MAITLETPGASMTKAQSRRARYKNWVEDERIEDYSLRYAPQSFRRWGPYAVATTALGGIAYLADFSIGGAIALGHGYTNAMIAIGVAALIIFLTGIPIAYYSARYGVDMDLLTRGSGFGYLGSTLTSIVYASFCFIFFALEGSIMAQALKLGLHIPIDISYLLACVIVLPLVIFGMSALSKMQVWTQPIWLAMMVAPFLIILVAHPHSYAAFTHWGGTGADNHFTAIGFGAGSGVALSLIAQIGEQADYLRFMPAKTPENSKRWWAAVISSGPGWVVLGALKQIGGAFLAFYVVSKVGATLADQPVQQYLGGLKIAWGAGALTLAVIFVLLSQVKINTTNAYSGSLSWSNFFSRILHRHPGRFVWIFFSVGISLLLMEFNMFSYLSTVLNFYSCVAIAWIGAITADLVINKPLGLSPKGIEFKRGHLYNFNPVGFGSMLVASVISISAYFGLFGAYGKAFSPFIALGIAMILSPILAVVTKGKYYIARPDTMADPLWDGDIMSVASHTCKACGGTFERPDVLTCPAYQGDICSLCCSVESDCHDSCKQPVLIDLTDKALARASQAVPAPVPVAGSVAADPEVAVPLGAGK
jgi:purine-cytosine permease-like protein